MHPIELQSPRLLLRPWRLPDLDDLLSYAAEPEYGKFLGLPDPYLPEHGERFIAQQVLNDWAVHPSFAIVLDGHAVGGTNIRVEPADRKAEIGYAIARRCWSQGLTTEAARAAIGWAFETYGLDKMVAAAVVENAASWRVMEKLGMTREGVFRRHRIIAGQPRDFVFYAVLREDWRP